MGHGQSKASFNAKQSKKKVAPNSPDRQTSTIMPLRSITIHRDGKGSLGFMFSTNRKTYQKSINHFVSVVEANGVAAKAGLRVGDRILRLNEVDVTSRQHGDVVALVKSTGSSVRLVVSVPNDLILSTLRKHASGRAQSVNSHPDGPHSPLPRTVLSGWTGSGANLVNATVVLRCQQTSQYLLIRTSQGAGWEHFEGKVPPSSPLGPTLVRILATKAGVDCSLTGVLRAAYDAASLSVIFLADLPEPPARDKVTLPADSNLAEAKWFTIKDAITLFRTVGLPPFQGKVGMQNADVVDWMRYVNNNGTVAPLYIVCRTDTSVPDISMMTSSNNRTSSPQPVSSQQSQQVTLRPKPEKVDVRARSSSTGSIRISFPPPPEKDDSKRASQVSKQEVPPRSKSLSAVSEPVRKGVSFSETTQVQETFSKSEYARALDPGADLSDLSELFSKNENEMEEEQKEELEESVKNIRVRAFYIKRGRSPHWGLRVGSKPSTEPSLTAVVEVTGFEAGSPLTKDLKVGDRLLKINGQWIPQLQHANYLLDALSDAKALDLTITRGEPLPDMIDLDKMSKKELTQAAFDHYGVRLLIDPSRGWTREAVLDMLRKRFKQTTASSSSSSSSSSPSPEATDAVTKLEGRRQAPAPPTSSSSKSGKKKVMFQEDRNETQETYAKEEYGRALDPGDDAPTLRDLFAKNGDDMEAEQEKEAIKYVEDKRTRSFYILRGTSPHINIKIKSIPRDVTNHEYMFLTGVEVSEIPNNSPVAKAGDIQVGDRLVKVNGKWVLNQEHAEYLLFHVLKRAHAWDLTITRNEPLPPAMDLHALSDKDLETAVFQHSGSRILVHATDGVPRDKAIADLRKRFADSTDAAVSFGADEEESDEEC